MVSEFVLSCVFWFSIQRQRECVASFKVWGTRGGGETYQANSEAFFKIKLNAFLDTLMLRVHIFI